MHYMIFVLFFYFRDNDIPTSNMKGLHLEMLKKYFDQIISLSILVFF